MLFVACLQVEQIDPACLISALKLSVLAEGKGVWRAQTLPMCVCRLLSPMACYCLLSCWADNQKIAFSCPHVLIYMVRDLTAARLPCPKRNKTKSFCIGMKLTIAQFPGNKSPHLKGPEVFKNNCLAPLCIMKHWLVAWCSNKKLRAQKMLERPIQP